MNSEGLSALIERVPWPIVLLVVLAVRGFWSYEFFTGTDSPLFEKRTETVTLQSENEKLQIRARELKKFIQELETKKKELRGLAEKLEASKSTLSETFDIPSFMQAAVTEARKLGLQVTAFRPTTQSNQELYGEQTFEFGCRGVFVQMLIFLHRVSQMQTIVRVDSFAMRPVTRSGKFVQLEGTLQIKGYYYLRSKADDLSRAPGGGS